MTQAAPSFFSYPGLGDWALKNLGYSQAVRVGDFIKLSGQGGWDAKVTEIDEEHILDIIAPTVEEQVDRAFANVDLALKHAGGQGWSQAYKVVTYTTDLPGAHDRIVHNLRKWKPNAKVIWTELGVAELGLPTMKFEIDVEAYDPTPRQ